ncbi:MAG: AMP-binding protein [Gammaproteobacteria bacterium]|nr:AMP-binding protein [Gammaproteobacteria bacterium]
MTARFPMPDFLARRAELGPHRSAMEDLVTGDRVTYLELHLRTGRSAALLASLGVSRGGRVAILCRNRIEFFEMLFACARLGAILVPLNWRMPGSELRPMLEDCSAHWLIHGAEDAANARELTKPSLALIDLDDETSNGFRARRDSLAPHAGRPFWQSEETWYLLYTSGTTGTPKAVIQTYGMALMNYINITQAMGARADDTTLNYLPLFHTGGINLVTLPSLIMGARVLITPGFDLERTVELIDSGRLDTFFGVPAVYLAISLHTRFPEMDLSKVRSWGCGGAPLPDPLFRRFAERGVTVLNGMGMTETGPTVFLMDVENASTKIGSVGKPQIMTAVRLVGVDGRDVPQGEIGEVWFFGPGITPGYYNRPDATGVAFTDDGWLRSGDLARQDEDGYYYVVGRLKDMYISGGENVYPAEVENILSHHPCVLEVAVVGVPDERWGETGSAYLMLRPEQTAPTNQELIQFCRERIASYKVPGRFTIVSEFPRTAAGKIQKHKL